MEQTVRGKGVADECLIDSAALVGYHSDSLPDERTLGVRASCHKVR